MKRRTTLINEIARKSLEISRDEYALCAYLLFRQGYPSQKVPGWCCDTKDELADFVGITRQGLYKMCNKLEALKLIEQSAVGGFLRATVLFIDSDNGVNKVDKASVNKVYIERKQSLQKVSTKFTPTVNKVDEVNKKDKKEKKEGERGENAPAPGVEKFSLNEIFSKAPPVPPPPPDGPRWQDVPNSNTPREFETYLTRFYANHPQELEYIRERTQFQNNPTGVPAAIADFCAWAVGEGWNRRTLQQINARFGRWLRDQTRFEQKKQGKKNEFKFRSPETITDALDFAARWQREQELGIPH